MKRITVWLISAAILVLTTGALKPSEMKLNVNGQVLTDLPSPIVVNGTAFIPIRAVHALGNYKVNWSSHDKTVTVFNPSTKDTVVLTVNKKTAYKNKTAIALAVAPRTVQGTTYVPIHFISESFGAAVIWDNMQNGIVVVTPDPDNLGLVVSNDLPAARLGAIGLPRVSWHEESLPQPEGMTYAYLFPENETKRFYFIKGSSVYFYEVKENRYAELVWEAKIDLNQRNANEKDTLSKYLGHGFSPSIGTQPVIDKRLVYFQDNTFINERGTFGIVDRSGTPLSKHEVKATRLSEIVIHVPEEGSE